MLRSWPWTPWRITGLAAGLLAFALLAGLDSPLHHSAWGARPALAAGGAALMAIWWLTEAVPIYWTACVPLLLFPATRVFGPALGDNLEAVVRAYLDPYIFLFAGGMAIAAAMQQWDLHRRIALGIMQRIGSAPLRLLAGFLTATAFISLWISNTATATMMMPIGIAVIAQIEDQIGGRRLAHYGMAIMLAIAYGANVGGIGTKIGTAPNAMFAGFMEGLGIEISFLQFLAVGLPFVLLFLPLVLAVLWRIGRRDGLAGEVGAEVIAGELARLGRIKRPERVVLGVFLGAAALWIAGKWLTAALKPEVTLFELTSAHVEGGTAVLAAIVLLAWRTRVGEGGGGYAAGSEMPPGDGGHAAGGEARRGGGAVVRRPGERQPRRQVLSLAALRRVPWETLLLLGGGFAMAAAIQQSGLSAWMSERLLAARGLPPFGQLLLASTAVVALSAVASNTATIAVMLVVLKDAVAPDLLTTTLFAATIASSCDFALPAGTPPNAIVFGSGYVTIPRMARAGALLDLAAAAVAAAWCWVIVRAVL